MERDILKKSIEKWVHIVNAEIGRTDKNEYTVAYFTSLIGKAFFAIRDEWYLVAMPVPNMWGDITLCVLSFYVVPEKRNNPAYLRKILRKLGVFAKISNARYIEIGSHINHKLHDFLQKQGYEISAVRRFLTWE